MTRRKDYSGDIRWRHLFSKSSILLVHLFAQQMFLEATQDIHLRQDPVEWENNGNGKKILNLTFFGLHPAYLAYLCPTNVSMNLGLSNNLNSYSAMILFTNLKKNYKCPKKIIKVTSSKKRAYIYIHTIQTFSSHSHTCQFMFNGTNFEAFYLLLISFLQGFSLLLLSLIWLLLLVLYSFSFFWGRAGASSPIWSSSIFFSTYNFYISNIPTH